MPRIIPTGIQSFETLLSENLFYVDKTRFIREWWENKDQVSLLTRPRRFGKTLTLSMLECFFSNRYAARADLFEGLDIWKDEKYRSLQGMYPVIFLSFANIKQNTWQGARARFFDLFFYAYRDHAYLLDGNFLDDEEKLYFRSVKKSMDEETASNSLKQLCRWLEQYHGKKPIILLDEYDTPLQEAWISGYWDEAVIFMKDLFNSSFKTNPHLGRAILTGITRISKESLFSDLNNIKVFTTTSERYADCFGFTEQEVFDAMDEYGLTEKEKVKSWYDGFVFGSTPDMYNPWSIINYLRDRQFNTYWADTSSNALVGELMRKADASAKKTIEDLLAGGSFDTVMDEQVVFSQLDSEPGAMWSMLVASGYLKVLGWIPEEHRYTLALTNHEVKLMMEKLIRQWFGNNRVRSIRDQFIYAVTNSEIKRLNSAMNRLTLEVFSFFDTAGTNEAERFYHGFVLGLIVDLKGRYAITSNRESGFGRYDILMEPLNDTDPAVIIEFKSLDSDEDEETLEDTCTAALKQIEDKKYAANLEARGFAPERIHAYAFAFKGKEVLVKTAK